MCRAFPDVRSTVADLPSVTPITSEFIEEADLADRIGTLSCNVVEEPPVPPAGPCDVAVLRAFVQVLSMEDAARAASPTSAAPSCRGGRIYIMGRMLDDSRLGPPGIGGVQLRLHQHLRRRAGVHRGRAPRVARRGRLPRHRALPDRRRQQHHDRDEGLIRLRAGSSRVRMRQGKCHGSDTRGRGLLESETERGWIRSRSGHWSIPAQSPSAFRSTLPCNWISRSSRRGKWRWQTAGTFRSPTSVRFKSGSRTDRVSRVRWFWGTPSGWAPYPWKTWISSSIREGQSVTVNPESPNMPSAVVKPGLPARRLSGKPCRGAIRSDFRFPASSES